MSDLYWLTDDQMERLLRHLSRCNRHVGAIIRDYKYYIDLT